GIDKPRRLRLRTNGREEAVEIRRKILPSERRLRGRHLRRRKERTRCVVVDEREDPCTRDKAARNTRPVEHFQVEDRGRGNGDERDGRRMENDEAPRRQKEELLARGDADRRVSRCRRVRETREIEEVQIPSGWRDRPRQAWRRRLTVAAKLHRAHRVEVLKRGAILDLEDHESRTVDCVWAKLNTAEACRDAGRTGHGRGRRDAVIDIHDARTLACSDVLLDLRPRRDDKTTRHTTWLVNNRRGPREDSVVAHWIPSPIIQRSRKNIEGSRLPMLRR